jgi:ATP-dependent Clp protease adaptor protein ClpS
MVGGIGHGGQALKVVAAGPTLVKGRRHTFSFGITVMVRNRRGVEEREGRAWGLSGMTDIVMAKNGRQPDEDVRGGIVTKPEPKTKKPSLYKVLLLNDDYTPMDFVVYVLERFFNKPTEEANRIMWHVHQKGVGICGVYTYEVAETKVAQVMNFARQHQHPLQCTMEKE